MSGPRSVDISDWNLARRTVLYQPQGLNAEKVVGMLSGMEIGSNGRAVIFLVDERRAQLWSPPVATYGDGPGQYKFVDPLPEIQALHDLLNGVKAGAPLPPLEVNEGDVNPSDDQPAGATSTRRSAAKVSRV